MGETWAIITQAAIFGIYHYYAYKMDILAMTTAAIAGLALGIIYTKTGSETSISLSHIIFNFVAVLIGGP
jgi:membrane protease YdiL (CAAX protease family)